MAKNTRNTAATAAGTLPDILDSQGRLRPGLTVPADMAPLRHLQAWLAVREQESNRQVRPAWMEVVQALIALTQQRLAQGDGDIERLSFETHRVAKQASRQRGERLQTRFVSDEIRRISSHQMAYLSTCQGNTEKVALVGWLRWPQRRGLGFAFAEYETAVALLASEPGPHAPETLVRGEELPAGASPSPAKKRHQLWLAGAAGFVASLCLSGMAYWFLCEAGGGRPNSAAFGAQRLSLVQQIQQRGELRCGVDGLLPHFSLYSGREQTWWGLDVELCRALAAALEVKMRIVTVSDSRFAERVEALVERKVDVLFRNTSLTIERDLDHATTFGPVYFYEKEAFLDFSADNHSQRLSLAELQGKKVCVKPGTYNHRALQQLQSRGDMSLELVVASEGVELRDNKRLMDAVRHNSQLCDFVFGNYHVLLLIMKDQEKRLKRNTSLRYLANFGLDPLAPVLLMDEAWRRVVSHSIYALMYADELQINSFNLAQVANSPDEIKKSFLQGVGTKKLELSENWVYRMLDAVGSYSEIYYRSFNCDYAACRLDSEERLEAYMATEERWPNTLFKHDAQRPGMLVVPRF